MLIFFHKQNLRDYISFDFIFRSQYHSVDGALNILSAIPTEGKDHPPHQKKKKRWCLGNDTKLCLMVWNQFWSFGEREVPLYWYYSQLKPRYITDYHFLSRSSSSSSSSPSSSSSVLLLMSFSHQITMAVFH